MNNKNLFKVGAMIKLKTSVFILFSCLLIFGNYVKAEDENWEDIINGFHPIKSCRINHSESFILTNENLEKLDEKVVSGSKIKCLNLKENRIREISKGFFLKLPNLRLINLENNALSVDGFFKSFPNIPNIETINLDRNKAIINLEVTGIYPKLKHLYLRNLGLHNFNFSLSSSLTHLYLSGNELSKGSTFTIPESVSDLFLNNNKLVRLSIEQIAKLKVLSVSENFFEKLGCINKPGAAFMCLKKFNKLERLFISNNNIYHIELNAFDDAANLLTLDLASNHIEKLDQNTFHKLTNLKSLNLSSNPLTQVPNLCALVNLETLILDHTRIAEITENKFCQLKNLKQLSLNNAGINKLSVNSFGNLISLEELNLSQNQLSTLEGWQIPFSLRRLFLKGNLFKTISNSNLIGAAFLEYLDLRENQIKETELRSFNISRLHIDL